MDTLSKVGILVFGLIMFLLGYGVCERKHRADQPVAGVNPVPVFSDGSQDLHIRMTDPVGGTVVVAAVDPDGNSRALKVDRRGRVIAKCE